MRRRRTVLGFSLLLIVVSWWLVSSAGRGLERRDFVVDGVPLLFIAPEQRESAPVVLIAHGFSGSRLLMQGYAYTLAHAGYATMAWDFAGNAAHARPKGARSLQEDVETAWRAVAQQPGVDTGRAAILGHSMGSGVAMEAALRHPDRFAATVAISPTHADVRPGAPRNLLLQAGSLEGRFVANARALLAAAGGPNQDMAAGLGRALVIVPGVEHISILFHPRSHRAAREWLDKTFDRRSSGRYSDRRILWYGLHLLGWLGVMAAWAPQLGRRSPRAGRRRERLSWWAGVVAGPLVATATLAALQSVVDLPSLAGFLVGGALALWFLVAGLAWLFIGGRWRERNVGAREETPGASVSRARTLLTAMSAFVILWMAMGAMAQVVWLQWWLITPRLVRWPLLALGVFPWMWASAQAQAGRPLLHRLLWWFGQCLTCVVGLLLLALWVPGMGFVVLLLPVVPIIFALLAVTHALLEHPPASALAGALFFAWALAAVFPLAT
ncbi:MAG: alpha/beta fold hydrolase [Caldilineae bacterium]|nr:MAG: alpha/beta fold hydrolase [Caldilineae bacterium]